jgi:hypothetical protein
MEMKSNKVIDNKAGDFTIIDDSSANEYKKVYNVYRLGWVS